MNTEHICYGCFQAKPEPYGPCPHCGFDNEAAHPPQALPYGTSLSGRYRTGRVLETGKAAVRYLAYDLTQGRTVELTEYFPPELAMRQPGQSYLMPRQAGSLDFQRGMDRFQTLGRALSQLQDKRGLVPVQTSFYENGTAYFVSDHLEGQSLEQYLTQHGGRLDYQSARSLLRDMMTALERLHQLGLSHLSICPKHVLVPSGQSAVLLGFGLAEQGSALSGSYAAPEQSSSGQCGPWTDVYALGALFYRSLAGNPPPPSEGRGPDEALPSPSSSGALAPPEAEQAILRALSLPADLRFQNMGAFLQALSAQPPRSPERPNPTEWAGGGAQNVTPPQPVQPVQPFRPTGPTGGPERKNRPPIAVLLIAALVVIGLAAAVLGSLGGSVSSDAGGGSLSGSSSDDAGDASISSDLFDDAEAEAEVEEAISGPIVTPGDSGSASGQLGDVMRTAFFDFKISSYEVCDSYGSYTAQSGNSLAVVEISVCNTMSSPITMYDTDFQFQWRGGSDTYCYPITETADSRQLPAEYELASGEVRSGLLIYEIPSDAAELAVAYQEYYSNDTTGDNFFVYFEPAHEDDEAITGGLGETLATAFFDFQISSAERRSSCGGYTPASGYDLLLVSIQLENVTGSDVPMYDSDFPLYWVDGDSTSGTQPVVRQLDDSQLPSEYTLEKDASRSGLLIYEVPSHVDTFVVEFVEYFQSGETGQSYYAVFSSEPLSGAAGASAGGTDYSSFTSSDGRVSFLYQPSLAEGGIEENDGSSYLRIGIFPYGDTTFNEMRLYVFEDGTASDEENLDALVNNLAEYWIEDGVTVEEIQWENIGERSFRTQVVTSDTHVLIFCAADVDGTLVASTLYTRQDDLTNDLQLREDVLTSLQVG